MVYYGLVHEKIPNGEAYSFLMESLSQATLEMPYRGPVLFERGDWKYENKLIGDIENLTGKETIYKARARVYEAYYLGGLADC